MRPSRPSTPYFFRPLCALIIIAISYAFYSHVPPVLARANAPSPLFIKHRFNFVFFPEITKTNATFRILVLTDSSLVHTPSHIMVNIHDVPVSTAPVVVAVAAQRTPSNIDKIHEIQGKVVTSFPKEKQLYQASPTPTTSPTSSLNIKLGLNPVSSPINCCPPASATV